MVITAAGEIFHGNTPWLNYARGDTIEAKEVEALISQSILGHKYTSNVLKSSRELVLVISTSCTGIEMDDVVRVAVPLGTVLFFLM